MTVQAYRLAADRGEAERLAEAEREHGGDAQAFFHRDWNSWAVAIYERRPMPARQQGEAMKLIWGREHTGGGCMALTATVGDDDLWACFTDEGGSRIPGIDEPGLIGLYKGEDSDALALVEVPNILAAEAKIREWIEQLDRLQGGA